MATAAEELARFASTLHYRDVPADARRAARQCVVDAIGVGLFGRTLPWSAMAREYVRQQGGQGGARILGDARRVPAAQAAFVNGVYVHAFEQDSLRKPGAGVHPGAALVPVALALGEELHASGETLLTAVIAGAEVLFRVGNATHHSTEGRGFHAPGLTGPFGAAACAGRLLGLDQTRIANALGIAGSLGSGSLAFTHAQRGAMVKRLHLGRAAESGVLAARLAALGYEGPETVLEGKLGFLQAYCTESDPALLTRDLGSRYEITRICIKRYPCHVTAHTPVQIVQMLRAHHDFDHRQVASVIVRASAKVLGHHANREPREVAAAQYSVPYCTAIALVDDVMDPEAFGERALANAAVQAMARAIALEPLPAEYGMSAWGSEVTLTLRDGRTFTERLDDFSGTPESPLSDSELRAKYMRCAGTSAFVEPLWQALAQLESVPDVAALPLA